MSVAVVNVTIEVIDERAAVTGVSLLLLLP